MASDPPFRPESGVPRPRSRPESETSESADFEEVSRTFLRSKIDSVPDTTLSPPNPQSNPKSPPRPVVSAPTQTTFGPFALLEKRGEGNMGQVYKARDEMLQRIVALKVIHPKRLGDKTRDAVARFQREAQALAQISHPNVIAVYRLDREGTSWYLAMEYVDGGDLQHVVAQGGPIAPERATRFLIQAAEGLGHVHERKVLHRDIKPSNLLVDKLGVVKVTDFGLAKFTGESWSDITQSGDGFFGTPDYMSPEQWRDVRETDERSDIYSLGCTLFYLCAGRNLYEERRQFMNKMFAHLSEPPPSLREASPRATRALESVYLKMVAKDPKERFQSMLEVADSLRILLSTYTQIPSPSQPPQAPPTGRGSSPIVQPVTSKPSSTPAPGSSPASRPTSSPVQPKSQEVSRLASPAPSKLEAKVNSAGMTMLLVPAGEFTMGSSSSDEMGAPDEKPQHRLKTPAFRLAAHPVTQGQFQAVMNRNPSYFSPTGEGRDEVRGESDRLPVETVSWFDAIQFCNQLSLREKLTPYYNLQGANVLIAGGDGYRLPFEREWERACRADIATRYFFGESAQSLHDYALTVKNSEGITWPVGRKQANPWGFYDMLGNVWEWCWDWHDPLAYSIRDSPKEGPSRGVKRVVRGGSFLNNPQGVRPAKRDAFEPATRDFYLGFRVARDAT